ncbi:MAG TPA: 16S rRNA (guanine(966)-N(2))-methyltransferase RsmD [Verrucomicrobiae bacterium]|nr:16S rRNA (guanine(966)-N(2))-methyltransferase RsmD [Verrucomicrobiae bacterium]
MRIIGGQAAGRLLKVPPGYDVRPTPDLVRQAIFNSLGALVADARVLDLFSGSGALGLECLSRGAASVFSVEKSNRPAAMIRENLANSGLPPENYEIRIQDAFTAIHQLAEIGRSFDLIVADPPFGEKNIGRRSTSLSQKLLDDEQLPKLLTLEGLFVLGHTKRDTLTLTAAWKEVKVLRHGDSTIRFLQREMKVA